MRAIVTICSPSYVPLVPRWMARIRRVSSLPVVIVAISGAQVAVADAIVLVPDGRGNPFPIGSPEHACAEKLRVFEHIADLDEVLFLDVDLLVRRDFWTGPEYWSACTSSLVAAPDLFVGYKELMEDEFLPFDRDFRMAYLPDGRFAYFNTGAFLASRFAHRRFFSEVLATWARYVEVIGRCPSVFDQNVFNYCAIRQRVPVTPMPVQNNCLRQYDSEWLNGSLLLDGLEVNAFHFNGGTPELKLTRWMAFDALSGELV